MKNKTKEEAPPRLVELMDFCKIARYPNHLLTTIYITDSEVGTEVEWIKTGEITLRKVGHSRLPRWEVSSYLNNARDVEHSSAYIFKMDLIGVEFDSDCIRYGQVDFTAYIKADLHPEFGAFRVPNKDYNPLALKETKKCKDCKGENAHVIVPSGYYVPPHNEKLYQKVRGHRIRVISGLNHAKIEYDRI